MSNAISSIPRPQMPTTESVYSRLPEMPSAPEMPAVAQYLPDVAPYLPDIPVPEQLTDLKT